MAWRRDAKAAPKFTFAPTITPTTTNNPRPSSSASALSASSAASSAAATSSSSSAVAKSHGKTPPHCVSVKKASLVPRGFKSFEDWNSHSDHVYIGRNMSHYVPGAVGSKWQNPFPVKKHGLEKCLEMYEEHVRGKEELFNSIMELEGKEIGCWCKPSPCHGDILIKIFNQLYVDTNSRGHDDK